MMEWLDNLREFHALSVFLRMTLAVFLGGFIGLERSQSTAGGVPHLYADLPGGCADHDT